MPENKLFSKTNNYILQQELQLKDKLLLLSLPEKRWLKSCLSHPAAADFLTTATREKLANYLADQQPQDTSHIIEKSSCLRAQPCPFFHAIREAIISGASIRIEYVDNIRPAAFGLPYKLEYSLLSGKWTLLWLTVENMPVVTDLTTIRNCQQQATSTSQYKFDWVHWEHTQECELTLVLRPDSYEERRRLLSALSCFEHKIKRTEQYQIQLFYRAYEEPLILKKLCELGRKITLIEPISLCHSLKEIALASLERYKK